MSGTLNLGISPITVTVTTEDRIETSSSSKGNQIKWHKDGRWVKADFMGYEGLAECFASWVARNTNIGEFAPIADYFQCRVIEESTEYVSCYSNNFLAAGETCITVQRLIDDVLGIEVVRKMSKMSTVEKVKTVVDAITGATGLENFGSWLTCLFEFDSLILNEDRHLHNIAVIRSEQGAFRLMTLFDNGAAFCSDTRGDYPLSMTARVCIGRVKAKPFSTDFRKQVTACRELYGPQLQVKLTADDVSLELLSGLEFYPVEVKQRVTEILKQRLTTYPV